MKKKKKKQRKKRISAADKLIVAEAEHLRPLLAEFGAHLSGFGNGVSVLLGDRPRLVSLMGETFDLPDVSFGHTEWKWVEPLLEELQAYRKKAGNLRFPTPEHLTRHRKKLVKDLVKKQLDAMKEMGFTPIKKRVKRSRSR